MRKRVSKGGLTVNAVAGSYVVVLGLNISDAKRKGLRGFAIKRTDKTEGESYWMSGTKTFESVEPHPAPGGQYSSLFHPFQSFQWSDYSAKPGYSYAYTVVAMYGPVTALTQGASVDVSVNTEPVEGAKYAIHFNRGSVATQEYARRFRTFRRDTPEEGRSECRAGGVRLALARSRRRDCRVHPAGPRAGRRSEGVLLRISVGGSA